MQFEAISKMPCSNSCDVKLFSKSYLCYINRFYSEVCSLTNKMLLFFPSTFFDNHDDIKYWDYKLTSANPGSRLAKPSIISLYRPIMFTHKSSLKGTWFARNSCTDKTSRIAVLLTPLPPCREVYKISNKAALRNWLAR